MTLSGNNIDILYVRSSAYAKLLKATACSVTFTTDYLDSYRSADQGSPRTTYHEQTKRGWSFEATQFVNATDMAQFHTAMRSGAAISVRIDMPYGSSNLQISGSAYLTRLSFAATGNGLLKLTLSATGNGAPTVPSAS